MAKVALSYGHGADTYEKKRSKFVVHNGKVYEEHTFNATVGEKVRKIIEAHGVQVLVLQPPFGSDVPLKTRTDKANAWGADIYWSIHANAGASSARGLCGFYWKGSKEGLKLAQLYAKYCKAENFPVYSDDYMYPSERGTWSDFHELRESKMPALLTENGFMTNEEDFKLIFENKDNFHDRLARAHAKAILEYFGIKYDSGKTGESKPAQPAPVSGHIGIATVKVDSLNLRTEPSTKGRVIRALGKGESYRVYEIKDGWYNLGDSQWASNVGGKYMTFKAVEKAPEPKGAIYTVVKGDTLWNLAQDYGTTVAKLKELNGLKSDLLSIGQKLVVGEVATHTVQKGDTLWGIAQKYNTTVAKIKSLNGLKSDVIQPNDKLRVK
jgi:LysM repeat protein